MNNTPRPEAGQIWRHKKRGTLYRVLHFGLFQAENNPQDGEPVLIYQSLDRPDQYWARPLREFSDGRFELEKAK